MNPTADILAQLDAIDALAAPLPKGPWANWKNYAGDDFANCRIAAPSHKHLLFVAGDNHPEHGAIAIGDFIAASRDGWPATVKALRVAVERLDRLAYFPDVKTARYEMQLEAEAALAAVRSLLKGEQPQ